VDSDAKSRFAHRRTRAVRYESICLRCFRTVGTADQESALDRIEARHSCLEQDVIQLHTRMGPKSVGGREQQKERA
jgi:hypothetical protein